MAYDDTTLAPNNDNNDSEVIEDLKEEIEDLKEEVSNERKQRVAAEAAAGSPAVKPASKPSPTKPAPKPSPVKPAPKPSPKPSPAAPVVAKKTPPAMVAKPVSPAKSKPTTPTKPTVAAKVPAAAVKPTPPTKPKATPKSPPAAASVLEEVPELVSSLPAASHTTEVDGVVVQMRAKKPSDFRRRATVHGGPGAKTTGAKRASWMAGAAPAMKCFVCDTAVYVVEKLEADGKIFHKKCFKCAQCKKTLSTGNFASLQGKIFCKPHFKQLFKLKGNYDEGFGSKQHKYVPTCDFEAVGSMVWRPAPGTPLVLISFASVEATPYGAA